MLADKEFASNLHLFACIYRIRLAAMLADPDSYQCAQLADAALQHAGVHVFRDDRPYGAVYPGSFVPVFQAFGWLP